MWTRARGEGRLATVRGEHAARRVFVALTTTRHYRRTVFSSLIAQSRPRTGFVLGFCFRTGALDISYYRFTSRFVSSAHAPAGVSAKNRPFSTRLIRYVFLKFFRRIPIHIPIYIYMYKINTDFIVFMLIPFAMYTRTLYTA